MVLDSKQNQAALLFTSITLIPFTLDIGTTEKVLVYRGDLTDTMQISRLPTTQVVVDSVEPSIAAATEQPTTTIGVGAGAITNTLDDWQPLPSTSPPCQRRMAKTPMMCG